MPIVSFFLLVVVSSRDSRALVTCVSSGERREREMKGGKVRRGRERKQGEGEGRREKEREVGREGEREREKLCTYQGIFKNQRR